jgi:putative membrane protein
VEIQVKNLFLNIALILPVIALGAAANPDSSFYKDAAEGGIAEVQLGTLAQQKSSNPSVKEYGAMMVSDHTAAANKLQAIASSKDIKLPTSPSVEQLATKTKLEVLSGDAFDKSYIKGMIKDHQDDIAMFKKEAASGQDPDAKAYAIATLPTLEKHLKKIESIAAAAGINAG